MDERRWRQVEALYHSVLEREPHEREAYLLEACQGDGELRREVESLLRQDVSRSGVLDRPAWEAAASLLTSPPSTHAADSQAPDPYETEAVGSRDAILVRCGHPFLWVVRLTAVVTITALSYTAFLLLQDDGSKSFRWEQEKRNGVWHVSRVDPAGPAAGKLQPGDRLVSLNGDRYVDRAGTMPYRRALAASEVYELSVLRDGSPRSLTLTVAVDSEGLPRKLAWFAVALVWCGIALFIGFLRPDQLQARLAFVTGIAVGLVYLQVGAMQGTFALWQPLHAVVGYHFLYRFPASAPPGRLWSVMLWLFYAGGAFAAATRQPITWTFFTEGPSGPTRYLAANSTLFAAGSNVGLFTFVAVVVGMVAVTARNYRLLSDKDERRRVRWIVYSSIVGLAPQFWYSAVAIYNRTVGPAPVPLYGLFVCAATTTIPISLAYAVVKHRVLDVKVAVRLGLQYVLAKRALQALVALPVAALVVTVVVNRHLTIVQLITESTGYLYWIAAAGLSLKFRRPLRQWLDRRFFQEQYDREQVLLGVLDELGKVGSIEEASRLVSEQLDVALHPKSMYLWYSDVHEIVLTYSSGRRLASEVFPSGGRLFTLLEQDDAVVDVPLPANAGLSRDESRWLARLEARLIVPITSSDERLVGVLMLGEKKSEEPYSASDRRLLQAIARQTAVARENLQLKAQVGEEQRIRHDVLARLDPGLEGLLKECPTCGACFDSPAETCDRDGRTLTLSLPVSRTIDGKYRLDQLIGKGGMGAVYEARDLRLQRAVAVKLMTSHIFGEERALQRFQREARTTARLNHPNIVSVYDYGALERGGAYLVMERIHGVTLRVEVNRAGALRPALAADWFEQMLDGVSAAHGHGIVHRDLKPENVVGQRRDSGALAVKILDFGLAKFRPFERTAEAASTITEKDIVVGTFGYMPPEQLLRREVDQRTDIFALGVMLVEMLTGHRPFQGKTYGEVLRAILNDVYHLPGGSSQIRALDELVQRCLAKEPQDRFSSAEALRQELIPALRACPTLGSRAV